jgi:anti-sigma factor RsiW
MIDCDETLTALAFGRADAAAEAHLAGCARCRTERADAERVARALAADTVPPPAPGLTARVLRAAEALLARNARRAAWPEVTRALAAALVPLPLVLFLDWHIVRAVYGLLSELLPSALSVYLVFTYAATLALLLALTYGAIPVLVERQARLRHQESHG